MSKSSIEQQLRSFLLGVAAFLFAGTIAELYLLEHYEETKQWIPILLSAGGFVICTWAWLQPGRNVFKILRWLMAVVALGSLYGLYLHFMSNFNFVREINPSFSVAEAIWPAIKGSHPLLAPGMLIVGALIAVAGTYGHPVLAASKRQTNSNS